MTMKKGQGRGQANPTPRKRGVGGERSEKRNVTGNTKKKKLKNKAQSEVVT